jgi:hypothetical protein
MTEARLAADHVRLVDTARYAIANGTERNGLAAHCREQLDARGCAILPRFLTDEAIAVAVSEAEALVPAAHWSEHVAGTAYLEIPDPSWPAGHPRRLHGRSSTGVVAYDQFPPDVAVRRLYEWDPLMKFLAAALGKERLFRYDDPLGALNLAVMVEGDELWWHFDQTDFVVSLALQTAEGGGDFEYVPLIRSADDENYEAVGRVLRGGGEGVVRVPMEPGTLMLFEGRRSLHRVTPITGNRPRLVALLAYDTEPGTCSTEVLRLARYGRTG